MAAQLFKLVINADTTTDTDINPEIERYFYNLREDERTEGTVTIPAAQFLDDENEAVVGALTTASEDNGYYLLFINGVLQQSDLFTVEEDGSEVEITDASTIEVGTPIILVVNNFAPTSDSDTIVAT